MVEGSERTFQIARSKSGMGLLMTSKLDIAKRNEVVRSSPTTYQWMLLEALSKSVAKKTFVTLPACLPAMKRGFHWRINRIIVSAEQGILCSPLIWDSIMLRRCGTEGPHSP